MVHAGAVHCTSIDSPVHARFPVASTVKQCAMARARRSTRGSNGRRMWASGGLLRFAVVDMKNLVAMHRHTLRAYARLHKNVVRAFDPGEPVALGLEQLPHYREPHRAGHGEGYSVNLCHASITRPNLKRTNATRRR